MFFNCIASTLPMTPISLAPSWRCAICKCNISRSIAPINVFVFILLLRGFFCSCIRKYIWICEIFYLSICRWIDVCVPFKNVKVIRYTVICTHQSVDTPAILRLQYVLNFSIDMFVFITHVFGWQNSIQIYLNSLRTYIPHIKNRKKHHNLSIQIKI